jgi:hypothetical protein
MNFPGKCLAGSRFTTGRYFAVVRQLPEGKKPWTLPYMNWVKSVRFSLCSPGRDVNTSVIE